MKSPNIKIANQHHHFMALALSIFGCFVLSAQQFSYKPINPAFGGDTFNYNWLLSSATAQNSLQQPRAEAQSRSELDQFGQSLNQQILNQLSRTLLNQQTESIGNFTEEGTFVYGDLVVEVFETGEGLVINLFNTTNGEQTQVIVPNQ
jgi:curli production assembly/transport component CsgF